MKASPIAIVAVLALIGVAFWYATKHSSGASTPASIGGDDTTTPQNLPMDDTSSSSTPADDTGAANMFRRAPRQSW